MIGRSGSLLLHEYVLHFLGVLLKFSCSQSVRWSLTCAGCPEGASAGQRAHVRACASKIAGFHGSSLSDRQLCEQPGAGRLLGGWLQLG